MPMSKRRRAEPDHAGKGDSLEEKAAAARAINAQPWQPPPGMAKLRRTRCDYFFAAPGMALRPLCPDCVALATDG